MSKEKYINLLNNEKNPELLMFLINNCIYTDIIIKIVFNKNNIIHHYNIHRIYSIDIIEVLLENKTTFL